MIFLNSTEACKSQHAFDSTHTLILNRFYLHKPKILQRIDIVDSGIRTDLCIIIIYMYTDLLLYLYKPSVRKTRSNLG